SLDELGGEIWRFEMATAAAAAVLGINPFDQPDVEAAKIAARQAMAARCGAGGDSAGNLPENDVLFVEGEWQARGSRHFSGLGNRIAGLMKLLSLARPGDYLAVLAYLPPGAELERFLSALKLLLQKKTGLPVTVGFGPRYLHSTGQLHKGDGNRGLFLQLLGELEEDLPLPGADYGFVDLITAQAHGDYQALVAAGRRILSLQCRSVSGILMVDELRKLLEQC
ncbi:MAG: transaldolase, partial [Deltaproteobacteria bacterium]|nr:transaldolase [Deltaproteobacteria bacterium]